MNLRKSRARPIAVIAANSGWNILNFRRPLVEALRAAGWRVVALAADDGTAPQLRSLGAGKLACALIVAWDERLALLTLGLVAFGRAISEVGAVLMVGGNIDGLTRVMTTAIALETSKGDLPLALALGMVLLGVVLVLNALIAALRAWRTAGDREAGVVA